MGRRRVPNSAAGWRELLAWAAGLGGAARPRRWGIEGAWGYGRGLAQHLVAAGETVYEVSPRWTAEARKSARKPGKSDALDALAVARLVLREAATLPVVGAEDETAVLDLLTAEREAAVAEGTRLRNQLHALLLQLDPEYGPTCPPSHRRRAGGRWRATPTPGRGTSTRSGRPRCGAWPSACGWRSTRRRPWPRRSGPGPRPASSP